MKTIAARQMTLLVGVAATLITTHLAGLGLTWVLAGVAASEWAAYLLTLSPFVHRRLLAAGSVIRDQAIHAAVALAAYGLAAAAHICHCRRSPPHTSRGGDGRRDPGLRSARYVPCMVSGGRRPQQEAGSGRSQNAPTSCPSAETLSRRGRYTSSVVEHTPATTISSGAIRGSIHEFWQAQPCGTSYAKSEAGTREYYDEIEAARYRLEPFIPDFAEFPRWHARRVLEIGVGAGTDFINFARAGAILTGVDLTPAAIQHARERLEHEGLNAEVLVADGEALPFDDGSFDLVYSWGVIHHATSPQRVIREVRRVLAPEARRESCSMGAIRGSRTGCGSATLWLPGDHRGHCPMLLPHMWKVKERRRTRVGRSSCSSRPRASTPWLSRAFSLRMTARSRGLSPGLSDAIGFWA